MNLTLQKITTFASCVDWYIWTCSEWLGKTRPFKIMWLYLGFCGPLSHCFCSPMHTDCGGKYIPEIPQFLLPSAYQSLTWHDASNRHAGKTRWCLVVYQVKNLEQVREHTAISADLVGIRGGFYLKTRVSCHWWQNRGLRKFSRKLDSM